jgi:hypothetical protein
MEASVHITLHDMSLYAIYSHIKWITSQENKCKNFGIFTYNDPWELPNWRVQMSHKEDE